MIIPVPFHWVSVDPWKLGGLSQRHRPQKLKLHFCLAATKSWACSVQRVGPGRWLPHHVYILFLLKYSSFKIRAWAGKMSQKVKSLGAQTWHPQLDPQNLDGMLLQVPRTPTLMGGKGKAENYLAGHAPALLDCARYRKHRRALAPVAKQSAKQQLLKVIPWPPQARLSTHLCTHKLEVDRCQKIGLLYF